MSLRTMAAALLDLLATRDVKAVDDAMNAFIDIYEGWLPQQATKRA